MKDLSGSQTLESMSQAVWYNQWTMKKFTGFLKGEILEVGCGIGNFTNFLTKYGDVWAIDINDEYIKQTKEEVGDKAQVGFGDIEKGKYFFNKKKFDAIVCINVLEHIERDEKALKNLSSLLKIKGFLILLVPAHEVLFSKIDSMIGHFRRYNKKSISSKLKNSNFSILQSMELNFLGAIGWFLAGKIFGDVDVSENKIKIFNFFAPLVLPLENIIEPPIGTSILIIAQKQ